MELTSLLIGILVMLAIYLSLSRVLDTTNTSVKRALAIFGAAIGLLTTFWLRDNPDMLGEYTAQIALAGLGVLLALLAFARRSLK